MDFGAIGALDHVTIRHDAVEVDEKAAAAGKFLAARVKGFDSYRRRFDPANQFGKLILRVYCRGREQKHYRGTHKNKRSLDFGKARGTNCFHFLLSIAC